MKPRQIWIPKSEFDISDNKIYIALNLFIHILFYKIVMVMTDWKSHFLPLKYPVSIFPKYWMPKILLLSFPATTVQKKTFNKINF